MSRTRATVVGGARAPAVLPVRAERLPDGIARDLVARMEYRASEEPHAALAGSVSDTSGVLVPWLLDPAETADFYASNPWLGAVGALLADAVESATLEMVARKYTTDGRVIEGRADPEEEARAMAWLLSEAFAQDGVSELDAGGFLAAACRHYDTNGNIFVEVLRDSKTRMVTRLALLMPQFVWYEIGRTASGGVESRLLQVDPYTALETRFVRFGRREAGDQRHEFLHERRPNMFSSVYGVPPWVEARESVTVDNAHRAYLKAFFQNHAAPRWLVTVTEAPTSEWGGAAPEPADMEAVERAILSYLEANKGAMAGRNLVLRYPGGIHVQVTALDAKLEDPTFRDTARNARDEILAVRHVSLIDLGLPEGGYRATAQTQSENFRAQVLEPYAAPVVRMVNKLLHAPPPVGLGIRQWDFRLKFDRVSELLERMKAITEATGTPILTPDEGREVAGLEKRGLDRVFAPASVAPLDDLAEELTVNGRRPDVSEAGPGQEELATPGGE